MRGTRPATPALVDVRFEALNCANASSSFTFLSLRLKPWAFSVLFISRFCFLAARVSLEKGRVSSHQAANRFEASFRTAAMNGSILLATDPVCNTLGALGGLFGPGGVKRLGLGFGPVAALERRQHLLEV